MVSKCDIFPKSPEIEVKVNRGLCVCVCVPHTAAESDSTAAADPVHSQTAVSG